MNDRTHDGWDIALLLYALAGSFISLAAAFSVGAVAAIAYFRSETTAAQSAQWTAAGLLTLAFMGAPAIWLSLEALLAGRRPQPRSPARAWLLISGLFPAGLLLGYFGYEREILTPLLGPLGQILAIATPAAVAVILVRRAGPPIPLRRLWGHILIGLWAVPLAALVIEGIFLLLGIFVSSIGLALTPGGQDLITDLQQLLNTLEASPSPDLMAQVTLHPAIIVLIVVFLGLTVPLIEELSKTAAIWPLLPRRISRGEAFLGGVAGGTGFALAEALFLAQPGAGWVVTATARAGATMMHALATGIASWSLAEGLSRQRWRRATMGMAIAVGLHGLWNLGAIGIGLSQLALRTSSSVSPSLMNRIGTASLGLILTLGLGAAVLLPRLQARSSRLAPEPVSGPTPDELHVS